MSGLKEDFDPSEILVQLLDPSDTASAVTKFEDLQLSDELLRGLYAMNYRSPSKIQERALPLLLSNPPTNMIAQSQSGTGKTAAFAITMLHRVDPELDAVQAVCIANTRELAAQIHEVIRSMAAFMKVTTEVLLHQEDQRRRLVPRSHVVVGTPGTLRSAFGRNLDLLEHLRVLVIDEADAMLEAQNLSQQASTIKQYAEMAGAKPQYLLFSATFNESVIKYTERFAPQANKITLRREQVAVQTIRQFSLQVTPETKFQKLADIYGLLTVGQSIVFVARRETARIVKQFMEKQGHSVVVLTSDEQNDERDTIMREFREGKAKVLVATNVLSRGIDVPQVNLVVNFDMPVFNGTVECETYIHRIGRTGRFGRSGVAINFCDTKEASRALEYVAKTYNIQMNEMPADQQEMHELLEKFK